MSASRRLQQFTMATTDKQLDAGLSGLATDDADNAPRRLSSRKMLMGLGAALLVGLASAGYVYLNSGDGLTPEQRLSTALELLDRRDNANALLRARNYAKQVEADELTEPGLAGATEYVLGIVAFRQAESLDEERREQQYVAAAEYLQEAERRAFVTSRGPDSRRPEWAFALGMSLHFIGSVTKSRPLLEEAVESYEDGKVEAAVLLAEIYLDLKTPKELKQALALNSVVIKSSQLAPTQRNRAYLQRAQILHLLNRPAEAEVALSQVSQETSDQGTIVFRALALMADGQYAAASQKLEPVATGGGLEEVYARQALFHMGICAEKLHDVDSAINHFERVVQKYPKSHEGLAASLRVGDLLRANNRTEEALEYYSHALRTVRDPNDFRNRWLSLTEFRDITLAAWNGWVDQDAFEEAIALAKLMTPLFAKVESMRLVAGANQRWAEKLAAEYENGTYDKRMKLEDQVSAHWRASGQSHAALASMLRTDPTYSEIVWTSAEHFRRGHDFEKALAQFIEFIDSRPKQRLPTAYVRQARTLMDLDRLDEALPIFQQVIKKYPTDPAAFEAQFVIGQCYLEQNKLDLAEQAWRDIVTSEPLSPSANEWRMALFSLGRLLYHTAARAHRKLESSDAKTTDAEAPDAQVSDAKAKKPDAQDAWDAVFTRWDETVTRFDEFLKRYPNSVNAIEARYLLAKALQQSSLQPRRRLETAETENARNELRAKLRQLLEQTIREFSILQSQLIAKDEAGRLNELGQRILHDSYFEIARTYYDLDEYANAINAYRAATNKYPRDPEVLLAYVNMTNCFDRLGKPEEARSMLEQAKVILNGLPEDIFEQQATNMNKQEWQQWLSWASRLH